MAKQIDIEKLIEIIYSQDRDLGKAINEAVHEGLFNAMHTKESGLVHYIDEVKVDNAIKCMQKKGSNAAEIKQKIATEIANGLYLTDAGKKVFLRERINERKEQGLLYKVTHPLQTIKSYLAPKPADNVLRAAGKLYELIKMSGEEVVPEKVKESILKLKAYDFLHPALAIMKEEKIKGFNYETAMRFAEKEIKKYGRQMTEGIEEMAKGAAVASAILLLASFFLLGFSASHMTGFMIATNKIPAGYPIGAGFILLIIALCLSFLRRRKKPKKKQSKTRKGRKK